MTQYQLTNWFGLFAPVGTPDDIVKKLNDAVASVQKNEDVKERMREQGTEAIVSTPEQFRSFIKTQSEQYAKIIDTAKITAE